MAWSWKTTGITASPSSRRGRSSSRTTGTRCTSRTSTSRNSRGSSGGLAPRKEGIPRIRWIPTALKLTVDTDCVETYTDRGDAEGRDQEKEALREPGGGGVPQPAAYDDRLGGGLRKALQGSGA